MKNTGDSLIRRYMTLFRILLMLEILSFIQQKNVLIIFYLNNIFSILNIREQLYIIISERLAFKRERNKIV